MSSSPNRLLASIFGAVYLLVGLLGFTVTAGVGMFDTSGGLLLGLFEVNIFHNVAHLLIGAALLLAGLSNVSAARVTNTTIGAFYLILGIAGLFLVGSAFNILAINAADNVLHFGSAAVLLAVGLGTEKATRARA
jgi:hypothetical protein